jgi:hypothetical protein
MCPPPFPCNGSIEQLQKKPVAYIPSGAYSLDFHPKKSLTPAVNSKKKLEKPKHSIVKN